MLYQYGGAYFDTDVSPGNNTLDDLIPSKFERHILYVEHLTQTPNPSTEELAVFSLKHLGNDAFITTRNNPLILSILNSIRVSYCCQYQTPNSEDQVSRAFAARNIRDITIGTTGPVAVRRVIDAANKKFSGSSQEWLINDVILRRVRNKRVKVTSPQINTINWLNAVPNVFLTEDLAINAITRNAVFEIRHFRIFRFEDYVDTILAVQGNIKENRTIHAIQAVYALFKEKKQSFQIQFIQITGKYELPSNLLKDMLSHCQAQTFFNLSQELFELAFSRNIFIDRIKHMLNEIEKEGKEKAQRKINIMMSESSRANYANMINYSIDVIMRLFNTSDEVSCFDKLTLYKGIVEYIEPIVKFAEYLNNIPNSDKLQKVDDDKLKQLREASKKCSLFVQQNSHQLQCFIS